MRKPEFRSAAGLLKVLGHPVRLKIVCGLLGEPANLTRIAKEMAMPISTLAQHLAVLRRAGVLGEERLGVEVLFHLADERVPAILRTLCSPETAKGELPDWSWKELGRRGSPARGR